MGDLGLKQFYLIKKVKKYFVNLKSHGIDISKSSFCYIPSYGINPGNTKLTHWIDPKYLNFKNIKIIFFHILAISSYYNYELFNSSQKNYKNIFITWGKKTNFKKKIFTDNLLNVNSKTQSNCLFFVIYLDDKKPNYIPNNVILFHKKNSGRSIFYLFKELFILLFKYKFNLRKFFHYYSAQTIFAEKLNKKLKNIFKNNNIEKLILPYEGQPFQNFVLSKLNKQIKTYGIIHSILPALPTNLIKRKGAPKNIYVSGQDQKRVLINNLGWNKREVNIIRSLRFNNKIKKDLSGSIFLPINLNNIDKIIYDFKNLLNLDSKIQLPPLKVRNHPAMSMSQKHKYLTQELEKLIIKIKKKTNPKLKKNLCVFIGPTSAVIELLVKNFKIIHIPINPILDIYSNRLFLNIESIKKGNFYIYKKHKKNNIVLLRKNYCNFNSLKIV
jgi:hypothetical protein